MTKDLSNTKSSLRKRFEQQVIVGLTILLIGVFINAPAQTPKQKRTTAPEGIESSHNTPPPIVVSDGSLIVESAELLDYTSSSGAHYYRSTTKPAIGHIRLLWDNGDILYEDHEAENSVVMIAWRSNNNLSGTIQIKGGAQFEIKSDGVLSHQSVAKRRNHKYTHPGPGRPFRIESIEIVNKNGLKTKFTAKEFTSAADFVPEEFRLMIWRH